MDSGASYPTISPLGRRGSSCQPHIVDQTEQKETYQENCFDWMKGHNGNSRGVVKGSDQAALYDHSTRSSLLNTEMSFGEVPVVQNTFSLPQSVFERFLASQQSVPITSHPVASTSGPALRYSTPAQPCRPSVDYVTDLTGNGAKRSRLSPNEESLVHCDKKRRELQKLVQRLDNTTGKVLELLKEQKARERLNQFETPGSESIDVAQGQSRYASVTKRRCPEERNVHTCNQDSLHQDALLVLGIDDVPNGTQQKSGHSYITIESAGVALNHQTLPRIIAVHSVMKNSSTSVTNLNHPLVETTAKFNINSPMPFVVEQSKRSPCEHVDTQTEVRQIRANSSLLKETTSGDRCSHNDHEEEIVSTKVISKKTLCSTSTSLEDGKKNLTLRQIDLLNGNLQTVNNTKHLGSGNVDGPGHFDHPGRKGSPVAVDHPEFVDHSRSDDHSRHPAESVGLSEHVQHPKPVLPSQQVQHPGPFKHAGNPDSDLYVGGPPLYVPVLDKSVTIERQKDANQEHQERHTTSPRLTKTVSEISQKIIETRERMKNETIEWKQSVLLKLEKRLIKKLRRAEHSSGEKTEIEDLRQAVPEPVTKKRKSKCQGREGRPSRQKAVTEDVMGDIAIETFGQKRRESQDSVTDSVTDVDDSEDKAGFRETEKSTTRQESLTENMTSDSYNAVQTYGENGSKSGLDGVTESVTNGDNVEDQTILQKQDKIKELAGEQTEFSPIEEVEKCEESQDLEISYEQEVKLADHSGNSPNLMMKEKEGEASDRLSDSLQVRNNTQKDLNTDVGTRNAGLETENPNMVDCMTTKHLGGRTELAAVSEEKIKYVLGNHQRNHHHLTPKSNTSEKFQAGHLRGENVFNLVSSKEKSPQSLKKDRHSLPMATVHPSVMTSLDSLASTKKKTSESEKALFKNTELFKENFNICSKQAVEVKPKTVDSDRNIWSTLSKQGIL